MTFKSKRISNFELCSVMLITAWALAAASSTYAQSTPAPEMAGSEKALTTAFMAADKNADGKIDKTEAAAVPALASRFQRIDSNGDGFISLEEYTQAMK